jgi:hypothetical protein
VDCKLLVAFPDLLEAALRSGVTLPMLAHDRVQNIFAFTRFDVMNRTWHTGQVAVNSNLPALFPKLVAHDLLQKDFLPTLCDLVTSLVGLKNNFPHSSQTTDEIFMNLQIVKELVKELRAS